jgi:hypothetical protein
MPCLQASSHLYHSLVIVAAVGLWGCGTDLPAPPPEAKDGTVEQVQQDEPSQPQLAPTQTKAQSEESESEPEARAESVGGDQSQNPIEQPIQQGKIQPRRPLFILNSGWNSCGLKGNILGTKIFKKFKELRDTVSKGYKSAPLWLAACYTAFKQRTTGKARYISTANPVRERRVTPSEMVTAVQELAGVQPVDVYMVGFSYGGPVIMRLGRDLPKEQFNLKVVGTIDPISQQTCNSIKFLRAYLWGGSEGCQQAPSDFSPKELLSIASRTLWLQFFQTEYSRLHSSPIPEADQNIHVPSDAWNFNAHRELAHDPVVWSRILKSAMNL